MTADAFLNAHQLGELAVFDLASRLTTIAIRDQMVRARLLADRLPGWLEKQRGSRWNTGRILVVGGGACGLTAAIALAQQDIRVDVVEVQNLPFHIQALCTSRWVDPTQYDWPADNWTQARFPWLPVNPARFPFPWTADYAHRIAANQWVPRLSNLARSLTGVLGLYYGIRAGSPRPLPSGALEVELFDVATRRSLGYDEYTAVVFAFGFGAERCDLPGSPHFRGYPFWMTDTFEAAGSGLPGGQGTDTVLLSGSGDGSLQDLIRIITRMRSARAVFDSLGLGLLSFDWTRIFSAEQRAERALNWSSGESYATPYVRDLHAAHRATVQTLLQQNPQLATTIAATFSGRPATTILVNRQDWFTCNYALNRFITLLLAESIQDGTLVIRCNEEVQQIFSANPPATQSPLASRGHAWQVVLGDLRTRAFRATVNANVLILRHGIDPPEVSVPENQQRRIVPRPAPPSHLF